MIGDNIKIGSCINKMDDKGRVVIPGFSGAETGEIVTIELVEKAGQEAYLRVWNQKILYNILHNLRERLLNTDNPTLFEQNKRIYDDYCTQYCNEKEIGKWRRLQIPKIFRDKLPEGDYCELSYAGTYVKVRKIH